MKTDDMIYAAIAFGGVVLLGLLYKRAKTAGTASAPLSIFSGVHSDAGGPNPGGSYFPPAVQSEWGIGPSRDAENQNGEDFYGNSTLPAWASL